MLTEAYILTKMKNTYKIEKGIRNREIGQGFKKAGIPNMGHRFFCKMVQSRM